MEAVTILGAGPAGASAAIAASQQGSSVSLSERSRLPRHKVCGEFLSPEIAPALESLGAFTSFLALRPARVSRMSVYVRSRGKSSPLPEQAYGLSRYEFDRLLFSRAQHLGTGTGAFTSPRIVSTGRSSSTSARGARLFGFKAHYEGPVDDAVELYFFGRGIYVGVNCIENNLTNVCGLAPESILRSCGFQPDEILERCGALKGRVSPLRRMMDWLFAGPLEFRQDFKSVDAYRCGDALSFVDPFTGSGLVSAVLSGSLAGRSAARGVPVSDYLLEARKLLERPFAISSVLRVIAGTAWAERLIGYVPGSLLFRLTRPHYANMIPR
jgi:hypothetical protein